MKASQVAQILQATEGEFRVDAETLHVRLALPIEPEVHARLVGHLPDGPVRGFGLPLCLATVVDAFSPGFSAEVASSADPFGLGLGFGFDVGNAMHPHDAAFQAGVEAANELTDDADRGDVPYDSVATFNLGTPSMFADISVNLEDRLVSLELFSAPGMQLLSTWDEATLGKLIEALQEAQRRLDDSAPQLTP